MSISGVSGAGAVHGAGGPQKSGAEVLSHALQSLSKTVGQSTTFSSSEAYGVYGAATDILPKDGDSAYKAALSQFQHTLQGIGPKITPAQQNSISHALEALSKNLPSTSISDVHTSMTTFINQLQFSADANTPLPLTAQLYQDGANGKQGVTGINAVLDSVIDSLGDPTSDATAVKTAVNGLVAASSQNADLAYTMKISKSDILDPSNPTQTLTNAKNLLAAHPGTTLANKAAMELVGVATTFAKVSPELSTAITHTQASLNTLF
jgi:hypothetical protein